MMDFTIGKLAAAGKVKIDTIRYYERQGLIAPEGRTEAGYRIFGTEAVRRVKFIRKAQRVGFTLAEISRLLEFGTSQEATAGDVLAITQKKIDRHQSKINELEELKSILGELAVLCPGEGPTSECPILDYLYPEQIETTGE